MTLLTYRLIWDTSFTLVYTMLFLLVFVGLLSSCFADKCKWQRTLSWCYSLMWVMGALLLTAILTTILCNIFVGHPDYLE